MRLHPEHGVNPSVDHCFWCGKSKGVALLGYNKNQKAPRDICTGYEPCDECKANMALGITFMEVAPATTADRPEIVPGAVPTGRWAVVKEEAVKDLPCAPEMIESILKARKSFIDTESYTQLGLDQGAQP